MTVRYMTKIPGKPFVEANKWLTNECDNKYANLFVNSSREGSHLAQEHRFVGASSATYAIVVLRNWFRPTAAVRRRKASFQNSSGMN